MYWSALDIVNQVSGEVGIPRVPTLFNPDATESVQNSQLMAALNSAGNELLLYYPWEQFQKEFTVTLEAGKGSYDLPPDWAYFIDQTQWDRTNRWPLLGPKSPAEWAWLKGGLIASFPRIRYRVMGDKLQFWPVPESNSEFSIAMEYISNWWVVGAGAEAGSQDKVLADGDIILYNPWLMIKFTKLKWMQLKQFDTSAAAGEFQRLFDTLKGKDVGAPVLSLVPQKTPFFIGPWSVPDGNWNV